MGNKVTSEQIFGKQTVELLDRLEAVGYNEFPLNTKDVALVTEREPRGEEETHIILVSYSRLEKLVEKILRIILRI